MSELHAAIVTTIQFALAIGAALVLWVIVGAVVHAVLCRTVWRATPAERERAP